MNELARAQIPTAAPETVIGASWAAAKGLDGPAAAWEVALREPCPVCGHPTGDCTTDRGAHRGYQPEEHHP